MLPALTCAETGAARRHAANMTIRSQPGFPLSFMVSPSERYPAIGPIRGFPSPFGKEDIPAPFGSQAHAQRGSAERPVLPFRTPPPDSEAAGQQRAVVLESEAGIWDNQGSVSYTHLTL